MKGCSVETRTILADGRQLPFQQWWADGKECKVPCIGCKMGLGRAGERLHKGVYLCRQHAIAAIVGDP